MKLNISLDLNTQKWREKLTRILEEYEKIVPSVAADVCTNVKRAIANDAGMLGTLSLQEIETISDRIVEKSLKFIEIIMTETVKDCTVFNQDS